MKGQLPIVVFFLFLTIILLIYFTIDSSFKEGFGTQTARNEYSGSENFNTLEKLEEKILKLEDELDESSRVLSEISSNQIWRKFNGAIESNNSQQRLWQLFNLKALSTPQSSIKTLNSAIKSCPMQNYSASGDVEMLNLYDILAFNDPDGGIWTQGWPIEYKNENAAMEPRLEVIVVPHSHDDPGWTRTFDDYFENQVANILDGMIKHLEEKSDLKFIYAEMSFFEQWWTHLNNQTRQLVKRLLEKGQFEIVTGGWVMSDEANSHYYSIIMELFEGHEFLFNNLDYIPTNHWAIDPFGLSPTIAYLLNRAGFLHMAIQRVHYSVKKHLAREKKLEFLWRQFFSGSSRKNDIFTHMLPFYSYDIPHSCGPDPRVCCQFDFRRLFDLRSFCPWGENPVLITKANVATRAALLLDQYRKKAQLYSHNVILVPLGDDFRYDVDAEWKAQYENYKLLFEYMNANNDWNVNARFGTLSDYFSLVHKRLRENQPNSAEAIVPILSGDFFTYADRHDHYWSGYFTSRPFYKHMDRSLQHYLHCADILFSLSNWKCHNNFCGNFDLEILYNKLVKARQALSLFQHHDALTGTASNHVVRDYGIKMLMALDNCKEIIARVSEQFTNYSASNLSITEEHFIDHLPEKVSIDSESDILIFNSLSHQRKEIVCLQISSLKFRVKGALDGRAILQQIEPILSITSDARITYSHNKFELCFLAFLEPLAYSHFKIFETLEASKNLIKIETASEISDKLFDNVKLDYDQEIALSNENIKAVINSSTGLLKSITSKLHKKGPQTIDTSLSFVYYSARDLNPSRKGGDSTSGAYLFLPDGPAKNIPAEQNIYAIVRGKVRSYLYLQGIKVTQQIVLESHANSIEIINLVNLSELDSNFEENNDLSANNQNFELGMQFHIPGLNVDDFYTDLNAFQMIRRHRQNKLPLHAQFYPMAASVFIENSDIRISLLGRQALGVSCLEPGKLQIMLDRRILQDDNRGLGQGIFDNRITESRFRVLIEEFDSAPLHATAPIGYHSLAANQISLAVHHPPIVLFGNVQLTNVQIPIQFSAFKKSEFAGIPCDVHMVMLRSVSHPTVYRIDRNSSGHTSLFTESREKISKITTPRPSSALILHRFGVECRISSPLPFLSCDFNYTNRNLYTLFTDVPSTIEQRSLTLLHQIEPLQDEVVTPKNLPISLDSMELKTYHITY